MIPKKKSDKPFKKSIIGKTAEIETQNSVFKGEIILETKNTIKIRTPKGEKTILKKNATITIDNEKIQGEKITKRTEDRIKLR